MLPINDGVRRLAYIQVAYILHKDGTVSDFNYKYGRNDDRNKYFMNIVQKNLPKPFPKDFEEEIVMVMVTFRKKHFDEIVIDYYKGTDTKTKVIVGILNIYIDKNYMLDKHQTPTPND